MIFILPQISFWVFRIWFLGFLEFQFQFKISKVTIIHTFYLKLHQRQACSLHFILDVCYFLKWVTLLGLALLYKGNFSNLTHSKNCYNTTTAIVFIITMIRSISLSSKSRICLDIFVSCTVWAFPGTTLIESLIDCNCLFPRLWRHKFWN